ncbi:hypothetical protein EMIT0347P_100029 [Pseudomonas sp. IT-347P]
MTGLTVDIPQGHRIRLRLVVEPRHPGDTFGHFALRVAGSAEATQITLDVSGKYRDPGVTERLGQTLQSHGFTGTGGASDQSVAVRQAHGLSNLLPCEISADYELRGVRHFVTQWLIFDYAWPIQKSERPDHQSGRTFP